MVCTIGTICYKYEFFFRDNEGRPLTKRGPDGKPPINRRLQVRQWGSNIIQKVSYELLRINAQVDCIDAVIKRSNELILLKITF